jgi:hypothetical protein
VSGRRFIVKVRRSRLGPSTDTDDYLTSLQHNPYQRPSGERSHTTSTAQSEAFRFRTRAAAEVAAVYVGGRVVRLVRKAKPPVLFVPTPEANRAEVRLAGLRRLCGFVQDGSATFVTISQDDATGSWSLRIGDGYEAYYGDDFTAVIDNAINGERE